MDASLQSQHKDVGAASTHDLGLRMDTSGTNEFPASNEPNRDRQHISAADRFGTGQLFAQSHQFLENVKGYFGVHSRQSVAIHDTLGEFRIGRLPKQDVNRIVVGHLGDKIDLIEDYMSIANPQDAFVGSPGFQHHQKESAPCTPVSCVSPGFLQPQHQPCLTMPLWSPIQFTQRTHHVQHASISPGLLQGSRTSTSMAPRDVLPFQQPYQQARNNSYEKRGAYQPAYAQSVHNGTYGGFDALSVPSSPATLAPIRLGGLNQYTSPAMHHMQQPSFPPRTSFNYGIEFSSPLRGTNAQPLHSYPLHEGRQRNQLGNAWANQCEPEFSTGQLFDSPPLAKEDPPPPFYLGDPVAIPLGQPTIYLSPPKKRNRKISQTSTKPEEERRHIENVGSRRPSTVTITPMQLRKSSQQSSSFRPSTRAPRAKGHFVHSICGTAFTSRYAVRKHHWGNKCDDLETTTGCWAKNKKPNVQWDEHPSCKEKQAPKARSVRSHQRDISGTISPEFRPPLVPVIAPSSQNTVSGPGPPVFNDLPQTVAKSTRGPPSSPPFRPGMLPYHTSRLPLRGGLDSLLTAVNIAVKIDAPTPQGRNDSVVSNLDAQVAATEERRLKTMSWPAAPLNLTDSPFSYGTHPIPPLTETSLPPLSEVGLDITRAQQGHSFASGEESTGEQQIQNLGNPNPDNKIIPDMDCTQPYRVDQPSADVHIQSNQKGPRRRVRGPHDSISKRELKMLLEPSHPQRKRQRPANIGNDARV